MGMKPRPKDPNQLAKLIVDIATDSVNNEPDEPSESKEILVNDPAEKSGKDKTPRKRRKGASGGHQSA